MSAQKFHDNADRLIDFVQMFIEKNLKKTGNATWECQQAAANAALNNLSATLNATAGDELTDIRQADKVFIELDLAMAEAVIEAVNIATMTGRMSDQSADKAQAATTIITDALVG